MFLHLLTIAACLSTVSFGSCLLLLSGLQHSQNSLHFQVRWDLPPLPPFSTAFSFVPPQGAPLVLAEVKQFHRDNEFEFTHTEIPQRGWVFFLSDLQEDPLSPLKVIAASAWDPRSIRELTPEGMDRWLENIGSDTLQVPLALPEALPPEMEGALGEIAVLLKTQSVRIDAFVETEENYLARKTPPRKGPLPEAAEPLDYERDFFAYAGRREMGTAEQRAFALAVKKFTDLVKPQARYRVWSGKTTSFCLEFNQSPGITYVYSFERSAGVPSFADSTP